MRPPGDTIVLGYNDITVTRNLGYLTVTQREVTSRLLHRGTPHLDFTRHCKKPPLVDLHIPDDCSKISTVDERIVMTCAHCVRRQDVLIEENFQTDKVTQTYYFDSTNAIERPAWIRQFSE